MCGINGFNFNQPDLINKMNQRIKHRGPDQEGIYCNDNFSLGRVSISNQTKYPFFNKNKSLSLVFDGEIYNIKELTEELFKKGHSIDSRSNAEVILHLYEEYGSACLEKLNGIFAFAILDIKKNELF